MPRKLPGGGQPPPANTPAGNALSDSEIAAILAASAQVTAAVAGIADAANQQLDAVASDCMWPPSGQVTVPLIPGLWSQTFQTPCLVTYSEARAVFAIGVILTGISLLAFGTATVAVLAGTDIVLRVAGVIPGGKAGAKGSAPAAAGEAAPAAAPEMALAA